MSYSVEVVADSVGPNRARVTTFKLKYPRFIHAEFLVHRAISKNSGSTRAIPTAKMIEWIEKDPAMPVYWGKNQKGMQATQEFEADEIPECEATWINARNDAIWHAKYLMEKGVHKQIASRILEPWAHINVVATATSWDNFFSLRCHKDAMPEIQCLAVMMARAYRDSEPREMLAGWWHLPFVVDGDANDRDTVERLLKISVARCARVSYLTFDGKAPDPEADLLLHDTLLASGHFSPFEHQAQCQAHVRPWVRERSGNFFGWDQYRQMLTKSVHASFDYETLDQFGDRNFIV